MSLLNDALRKKSSENKNDRTGFSGRAQSAPPKMNGRRFSRICGLPFILGIIVFGAWYFWGTISAQTDTPIVAGNIAKDVAINAPDPISEPDKDETKEDKHNVTTLASAVEIAPVKKLPEIDTIKKPERKTKSSLTPKKSPPSRKAAKKPNAVKAQSAQETTPVEDKPLPPNQIALFLQKALRYHRQGKFDQAIQMYQQVLRVQPDHREALFNLASAYIQLADYSDAYPLLKKLRSKDTADPDILVNLAIVEIGMGKPADAIALLDLASKKYEGPKFEIYFHRAVALSRLTRLEEALISYRRAEEINPEHPTLNFNLAVLCDKLNKYHEAVDYYRAYMRHSGDLPRYEEQKIESRIRSLRIYLAGSGS